MELLNGIPSWPPRNVDWDHWSFCTRIFWKSMNPKQQPGDLSFCNLCWLGARLAGEEEKNWRSISCSSVDSSAFFGPIPTMRAIPDTKLQQRGHYPDFNSAGSGYMTFERDFPSLSLTALVCRMGLISIPLAQASEELMEQCRWTQSAQHLACGKHL